jgi:hypothetical protein
MPDARPLTLAFGSGTAPFTTPGAKSKRSLSILIGHSFDLAPNQNRASLYFNNSKS